MRLPRGAPRFRMTFEGVGETSGLADALNRSAIILSQSSGSAHSLKCYLAAALSRLLHALQNFGHVTSFSALLAAFASFHSTPHFFVVRARRVDRHPAPFLLLRYSATHLAAVAQMRPI